MVESVLSVVSKSHLCENMVATFGASVTDRQRLLLSASPVVTLWFDNDQPGWKATRDVGKALMSYCDVWVVESEWAADPADLSEAAFTEALGQRVHFMNWAPPRELKEWIG